MIDTLRVAGGETYERPAIAGSGTIATGLAACATLASTVRLLARSDASAWRAEEQAQALCAKLEGADGKRIKVTTDPGDLADCDLIVEAVIEELGTKADLLKTVGSTELSVLSHHWPPQSVSSSNQVS